MWLSRTCTSASDRESTPLIGSPTPIPEKTLGRPTTMARHHATPGTKIQIYDDLISPTRQPQTPEQLPEARHQSKLLGSYTAPVDRLWSAHTQGRTTAISRRQEDCRGPSPTGIRTPGFEGLYGGRENDDDMTLFDEASEAREQDPMTSGPRRTSSSSAQ